MKRLAYLLLIISSNCMGQSTIYTGTGSWSNSSNWSSGIPDSLTNVNISISSHPVVDGVVYCNSLSLLLSSITINAGGVLTIFGEFSAPVSGSTLNNGTIILKGNLKPALGSITLTVNGEITIASGLTFPTFTID